MTSKEAYSYVVLRYVHDVLSGEFVNVGVVMVAPRSGKFLAKTRKTIGRIKHVFPDLDRNSFVSGMNAVDRGIRAARKAMETEGMFSSSRNAASYARDILPSDDSSLQWSPVASGLSSCPEVTFDRLFERFVTRYDTSSPARKDDEDVWRPVRDMLSARGLKLPLARKVVSGTTDEIEFSRAWKNGIWHAYEPVSFDLADAEGIKNKARKWRGHLAAAAEGATEDVHLSFLIGRPEKRNLLDAYHSALDILRGAPFNPSVFEDTEVEEFVRDIEDEYRLHLSQDQGHSLA